ncbi:MAG: M23 family metallopeptidase [Bacteroidales bacterium]|jgi:murein DD-endopeptidase MepM/ murein hydrolase activator NlpD|nr:M23 family metallopeptidase [Bacteroidales bacterium]
MLKKQENNSLPVAVGLSLLSVAIATGVIVYFRNRKVKVLGDYPVKITSPFGYRIHPITGERKLHNGIDLSAPIGTPVYSPMAGTVSSVWQDSVNGIAVKLNHNDSIHTVYCHLSKVLVGVGQKIRKGEIVALTGNTGASTGPHLHFGVWNVGRGGFVEPKEMIF